MKSEYLEAYEFYKRQYPEHIILFHIKDNYCALEDDAGVVAKINSSSVLYNSKEGYCWSNFNQNKLQLVCDKLKNIAHVPVTVIDYRNDQGSFDIPKVKQILQDMEDDY